MDLFGEDLLLQLTAESDASSLFRMNPTMRALTSSEKPRLGKSASFDSLVQELFRVEGAGESTDIQTGFAMDSKCGEEALKAWQPSLHLPPSSPQEKEAPASNNEPPAISSAITNMAQMLEFPTKLQVTQKPEQNPDQSDAISSQKILPGLPVFSACQSRPQSELERTDIDMDIDIDEILSPLSSVSGAEVTQAAQMPRMEMPQVSDLVSPSEAKRILLLTAAAAGKRADATDSSEFPELSDIVNDIKSSVAEYHRRGGATPSNGKIQVHEVVLTILLSGLRSPSFNSVLCFSNEDGLPIKEVSENFVARDTKAMGRIWQILKGNRNANFDTFARAMRVGRERKKDYFVYLTGGKASKKRVYKLGAKAVKEFDDMRRILLSKS